MGLFERWRESRRRQRAGDSGRPARTTDRPPEPPLASGRRVRIVTYNVHGCVGVDGRRSAERIAEAIAPFEPDVVALQELDVQRVRSEREDQPALIAKVLRMEAHFAASFTVGDERYGNAILSRFPLALRHHGGLPGRGPSEPRGALWAVVDIDGQPLHVLNTHLGLSRHERLAQAMALLGNDWVGSHEFRAPAVLCGDLNALPRTGAYQALARSLRDAQLATGGRPGSTFPSRFPTFRIDHIFVDATTRVESTCVLATPLTRVASDHLPLMATLVLAP